MTYGWLEVEELLSEAKARAIGPDVTRAALDALDAGAVRTLLGQLQAMRTDPDLIDAFACAILDAAIKGDTQAVINVCAILLELGMAEFQALAALGKSSYPEALALIRQALDANWTGLREKAASVVIDAQYGGQAEQALQDDSEIVRHRAAKQLEKQGHTAALIQALSNDSVLVRRVAAWHMGRRLVKQAVEPLMRLAHGESDIETLRASIWSLGVLRNRQALECLQGLRNHANPLVAVAAHDALSKLIPA